MKRFVLTFFALTFILSYAHSQRLIKTLSGHQNAVTSLSFSSTGAMILSAGWDKTIRTWNPATGATTRIIETGKNVLFSAALSKDSKTIVSGNWSPDMNIYQSANGDLIKTIKAHRFKTNFVTYSPDGKLIASVGVDTVKLWNATDYSLKFALGGSTGDINMAAFSPDSRKVAISNYDGWIYLWNTGTGELLNKIKAHPSNAPSLVFSSDGTYLLTMGEDGTVKIWYSNSLEPEKTLSNLVNGANSIDFSSDGKTLALAGKDNMVYLINVWESKIIATLKGHTKPVNCVKFSPNGEMLATAGDDSKILLWDLSDLKYIKCLEEKMQAFADLKKPKDEFETTEQYNKRLGEYEVKKAEMKKQCMSEDAISAIEQQATKDGNTLSSYRYVTLKIQQLNPYNADKQTYDLTIEGNIYNMKMPLQEAKSFKNVWQNAVVKGIQRVNPSTGKVEYINMQVVHPVTNVAYMTGPQVLPSADKYLKEFLDKNPQSW